MLDLSQFLEIQIYFETTKSNLNPSQLYNFNVDIYKKLLSLLEIFSQLHGHSGRITKGEFLEEC